MNLLLDTGMLGQLCHSGNRKYRPIRKWLEDVVRAKKSDLAVFLPEICDYELRRKLLHLVGKGQASGTCLPFRPWQQQGVWGLAKAL